MRGGRAGFALICALAAASVAPGLSARAAAAASGLAAPARIAPNCTSRSAPAQPVKDLPWAQQRYAPDRLAGLATGVGVTVGVIDSGVNSSHPQLRGRVANGTDFLDRGANGTLDCVGHGTAVASIIAATPLEGIAFRGLAPDATILPVRISEQEIIDGKESGRTVTATQFAQAIRWVVDHGAKVLNLSVVIYEDRPAVRDAISYAIAKDVVVVAAVGNLHENGDPPPYPAAYDGVLGVGAVGADGRRQPYSQVGAYVDVVAPGGDVITAAPGRGHTRQNGTSYATPFVTATAALVRQYWPKMTAKDVIARIIATADPAAGGRHSHEYGSGVVNPYRAVTETVAVGRPQRAAALAPEAVDPIAVARQERRSHVRERSLRLAATGTVIAAVALLLAAVLPRGARRRWRAAEPR